MWDCKCKKNYLNTTYLCIIIKKNHQITSYFLHLTSYFILPTCPLVSPLPLEGLGEAVWGGLGRGYFLNKSE